MWGVGVAFEFDASQWSIRHPPKAIEWNGGLQVELRSQIVSNYQWKSNVRQNTQEVDSKKVSRPHGSMRLPTRCVIIVNSLDRAVRMKVFDTIITRQVLASATFEVASDVEWNALEV